MDRNAGHHRYVIQKSLSCVGKLIQGGNELHGYYGYSFGLGSRGVKGFLVDWVVLVLTRPASGSCVLRGGLQELRIRL